MTFADNIYRQWDAEENKSRHAQLIKCKSFAWFMVHKETREVRVAASACGLRWCPICIRARRYAITANVKHWLKSLKNPKFITLTLKHREASLSEQIDDIYRFFRKIRQDNYWKKHVKGGIWFFQIKKSKDGKFWHPHIHALIDAKFTQQKRISKLWREITHGSYIVDIRAVKQVDKAAEYVARYASAPCRLLDLSVDDALDVVKALHGRRICGTWGTAKGVKLRTEPLGDADDWIQLESFYTIINSDGYDPHMTEIWRCWTEERPFMGELPTPPPDIDKALKEKIEAPRKFIENYFTFMHGR